MQIQRKESPYFSPRLMDARAEICSRPATLISAPPCAGKTTSMRHFAAEQEAKGTKVLWYTAFGETTDMAWTHICSLLQEVDSDTALLMGKAGFPVRQTLSLLAQLMQRLQCSQETILVIDNAHMLKTEIYYELVCALAQHRCNALHIVLITQNPIVTATFPAGIPDVLVLDTDIFFFTEQEAAGYFMKNGVALGHTEIRQVMENTLGWAGALHLQLAGYRKHGQIQKEKDITRLLRTAMWSKTPKEMQQFLLILSQTESVNLRQMETFLGWDEIPENIVELAERDVFIHYDQQNQLYTLHGLVREFLQPYFDKLPQKKKSDIYVCLSNAYLLEKMHFPAARMLLLAGKCEKMLAVPLTNADMAGYKTDEVVALLKTLLAACPPALMQKYPAAMMCFASEALIRGEEQLFGEYCALVSAALKTSESLSEEERRYLRGEYIFLQSFALGNDLSKINLSDKTTLKILGGPLRLFDTQYRWMLDVPSILAPLWSDHAPLRDTLDAMEHRMPLYRALNGDSGGGILELIQAEALLNKGQIEDAEILCHKILHMAKKGRSKKLLFCANLMIGRIALLHSDAAAYSACLKEIRQITVDKGEVCRLLGDQCIAFLDMALGRTQEVAHWLQNETEIRNRMHYRGSIYGMLLLGKYLLLQKEYAHLLALFGSAMEMAASQHVKLPQVYFLLYLACAKQAMGNAVEAQQYLQHALDIALPDEIYLPFAEFSEELAVQLTIWKNRGDSIGHYTAIQHLAKAYRTGKAHLSRTLYGTKLGLTSREIQIAQFAAQSLSNKQIAEVLSISPETVKTILKNVFIKLDIKSRAQLNDYIFVSKNAE